MRASEVLDGLCPGQIVITTRELLVEDNSPEGQWWLSQISVPPETKMVFIEYMFGTGEPPTRWADFYLPDGRRVYFDTDNGYEDHLEVLE